MGPPSKRSECLPDSGEQAVAEAYAKVVVTVLVSRLVRAPQDLGSTVRPSLQIPPGRLLAMGVYRKDAPLLLCLCCSLLLQSAVAGEHPPIQAGSLPGAHWPSPHTRLSW